MSPATETTYALDASSLATLNHLAQRWQVSKAEALQRALQQAAAREPSASPEERIAALHQLQKDLKDRDVDFDAWQQTIRDGRR